MAIIYKIENKLNHKKYIGQSKLTLEWRLTNKWCGHLVAAENGIEEKHFIWTSQLEHYLNKGYTKGLSPSQKECFCYNQKGKPRTKEERSKISKTLTGKKKTLEHAKHISEGKKGKKLSEQTKKNVSIGTKLAMASLSEEKKRQMREKSSAALKGRKRVTNGKENRYVKGEELEKLLSQGWYYGTGKVYVTNERKNKMVYLHELEDYLNKGYRRGLKKHENKEN